jgi:hypothetical protein
VGTDCPFAPGQLGSKTLPNKCCRMCSLDVVLRFRAESPNRQHALGGVAAEPVDAHNRDGVARASAVQQGRLAGPLLPTWEARAQGYTLARLS